jgi:hypothetical protein
MSRKPRSIRHLTCPVCKRVIAASGETRKFYIHMPYEPGKALFTEKGQPCKASGKTRRGAEVLAAEIEQRRQFPPAATSPHGIPMPGRIDIRAMKLDEEVRKAKYQP